MDESILRLDEAALAAALDRNLEEYGLADHTGWTLDVFSDSLTKAVKELTSKAFDDWGCLSQPDGARYDVTVYALDSEHENSILVAVGHAEHYSVALCSLTVDVDRLAQNIERSGPSVLADVLSGVLHEANRALLAAREFPLPAQRVVSC